MADMPHLAETLDALIANHGRRPDGCSECPFATVSQGEDGPNPADPDEGYYDCSLLNRERIWGEGPVCSTLDWLTRIRDVIEAPIQK